MRKVIVEKIDMKINIYTQERNSQIACYKVSWNSLTGLLDVEWKNVTPERPLYHCKMAFNFFLDTKFPSTTTFPGELRLDVDCLLSANEKQFRYALYKTTV